jgi:hypothetical protein
MQDPPLIAGESFFVFPLLTLSIAVFYSLLTRSSHGQTPRDDDASNGPPSDPIERSKRVVAALRSAAHMNIATARSMDYMNTANTGSTYHVSTVVIGSKREDYRHIEEHSEDHCRRSRNKGSNCYSTSHHKEHFSIIHQSHCCCRRSQATSSATSGQSCWSKG